MHSYGSPNRGKFEGVHTGSVFLRKIFLEPKLNQTTPTRL